MRIWRKNSSHSSLGLAFLKFVVLKRDSEVNEWVLFRAVFCVMLLLIFSTPSFARDKGKEIRLFNIPQQRVGTALIQFAGQAGLTLMVPFDQVEGKIANRLVGKYPINEAVVMLLLGTGLQAELGNKGQLSIIVSNRYPGESKKMTKELKIVEAVETASTKTIIQKCLPKKSATAVSVAAALSIAGAQQVCAQESDSGSSASSVLEEVVTLGTRSAKPRSVTDSPAPVDVISGDDFSNQGDIDTSNLIRNVVPSYNVNDQPISDAGTLVRAANLRGLAPDHTLLLVNGKRRHRASVITWLGYGINDGAQGPDTAAIPALALKSVEVLRDGAAAQYGSDAVAGVLNFNLKDSDSEGAFEVKFGQYSEGDGDLLSVAVNQGFSLGDNGFLNVTAEYSSSDPTDRAIQRADAAQLIAAGYQNVPEPAMVWGLPEVSDDIKLWANFGGELTDGVELFGQANYNSKEVVGGFYYRNPTNRGGVYSADGGETLLIGDLTPGPVGQDNSAFSLLGTGDGIDCPTVAVNGVIPDPAAFAQVQADPNCFSFQETITGGFTPNFGGDVSDNSLLVGLRGETNAGLNWSVSAYYGKHESEFFINNTVNASLGPNTPRDFQLGAYSQTDTNLNADFSYAVSDKLNLAFGAEYRSEEFGISPGQLQSYIDGGLGAQGFSTSSNGFPGFAPAISGDFERTNTAVYLDAEWDASDDLLLTAAVRFEDFDDFGSTTNFKVGGNWTVSDGFGIRSTVSTGFKAPTPGQSNASNITTAFDATTLTLVNRGVIPSTSPAAVLKGGTQLQPEESTSFTLGTYFTLGAFDFTIDYFDVDVDDRLNLSSNFNLTAADRVTLAGQGIDASDISEFRFFTNQFDTNTSGIDIVVSTETDWLGGSTKWNLAYNNTETEVTRRNAALFDDTRLKALEDGVPDTRWNLSANHLVNDWRFLARLSYYGEYFDEQAGGSNFDANTLLDLEAAYSFTDQMTVTLGARNVTDETGCSTDECGGTPSSALGLPSSQFTPFGFSGAFYYLKLNYDF